MPAFILRQQHGGQLSIHHAPDGKYEWKTDRYALQSAEAEASRARFRDDHAHYMVLSGIFRDLRELESFVLMVNQGKGWNGAWRAIEKSRVGVQV